MSHRIKIVSRCDVPKPWKHAQLRNPRKRCVVQRCICYPPRNGAYDRAAFKRGEQVLYRRSY